MHFINKQKNYTFTIIRVSVTKYTHHIHIIETIPVEKKQIPPESQTLQLKESNQQYSSILTPI